MYSNELICDILLYIDKNINNEISIYDLSTKFNFNRYYLMKLFKKEMNLTIIEYINSLKIYNSINLIKSNNYSLTRISIMLGFNSLEYFSRTFKKITLLSPNKYIYFFYNNSKLSDNEIYIINKSIINLFSIIKNKNKYLNNKKITVDHTLSIFKKKY